jgi:D-glycero-D-manno-heptose 1,7-bisphosphate phosphatase
MQRAVFLDRDGTVSEEAGYINHIGRFRVYPWTARAIRRFNDAGLRVILVTNQSGVGRGYFPETLLQETHAVLERELEQSGAHMDAIYFCPHHPDARLDEYRQRCSCRKPEPGMILRAAEEWNLDLGASFLVGDRFVDIETAHRAGVRGVLVLSGYGRGEYLYEQRFWPRQPDHIAEDLAAAADWILQEVIAASGEMRV